jgi:hypothetical protein
MEIPRRVHRPCHANLNAALVSAQDRNVTRRASRDDTPGGGEDDRTEKWTILVVRLCSAFDARARSATIDGDR